MKKGKIHYFLVRPIKKSDDENILDFKYKIFL